MWGDVDDDHILLQTDLQNSGYFSLLTDNSVAVEQSVFFSILLFDEHISNHIVIEMLVSPGILAFLVLTVYRSYFNQEPL